LGHQNWWPGETPLEIAVGAILTQNTNWTNVEKAIVNLKEAGALDIGVLNRLDHQELAALIRPAGYFNIKAKHLKNFIHHIVEHYGADLGSLLAQETQQLREELLSISGIGPETADSIALYAGEHPVFVVDAYTQRILYRHELIDEDADYFSIQDLFESSLPQDVPLYNDFHAQLVIVGKKWCKKSRADCENCPLKKYLPYGFTTTVTD
jgi:endonuclease-3 related protein